MISYSLLPNPDFVVNDMDEQDLKINSARFLSCTWLVILMNLATNSPDLYAKGILDLKPLPAPPTSEEKPVSSDKLDDKVESELPTDESETTKTSESKALPPTPPQTQVAEPSEDVGAVKPVEPSATSKFLANKLSLSAGMSFSSVNANGKSLKSFGSSQISASFHAHTLTEVWSVSYRIRYDAIEVRPRYEQTDYQGTFDILQFGTLFKRKISPSMISTTSAELGLLSSTWTTPQFGEVPDTLQKRVFTGSFGSGVLWTVNEKVYLGPEVRLFLGTNRIFQIGVGAEFVF